MKKPVSKPFVLVSGETVIQATDRETAVQVAKTKGLTSIEPEQHDTLHCTKGGHEFTYGQPGVDLDDDFDHYLDLGWDCILVPN